MTCFAKSREITVLFIVYGLLWFANSHLIQVRWWSPYIAEAEPPRTGLRRAVKSPLLSLGEANSTFQSTLTYAGALPIIVTDSANLG